MYEAAYSNNAVVAHGTGMYGLMELKSILEDPTGDWVSAKNINFYNVRPPLDQECILYESQHLKFCFVGTQYCLTVHLFTDRGKSTSVTKKCATGDECHFVGCHHHRESGHTKILSEMLLLDGSKVSNWISQASGQNLI
ncbi:UNVERIFIED_CONTAM: hypothetical protein H355_004620 [Colinus virginianus]|nr:hypothetical protein H355_004620 [Colinus virginianus]